MINAKVQRQLKLATDKKELSVCLTASGRKHEEECHMKVNMGEFLSEQTYIQTQDQQ